MLKTFIEDNLTNNLEKLDLMEANDKGLSLDKVKQLRIKHMTRQTRMTSTNQICLLSDEMTSSDGTEHRIDEPENEDSSDVEPEPVIEEPSSEMPGNAQFLETPSVTMPIDFSGLSYEGLFGKRREVYKMNPRKLNDLIDCQFCKLIFDYTEVCKHFSTQNELKTKDIKNLINES
jgi:hypothetical protein